MGHWGTPKEDRGSLGSTEVAMWVVGGTLGSGGRISLRNPEDTEAAMGWDTVVAEDTLR